MPIQTLFKCNREKEDCIEVYSIEGGKDVVLSVKINGTEQDVYFDIPTAIKFSKTVRTEINKIKGGLNV